MTAEADYQLDWRGYLDLATVNLLDGHLRSVIAMQ
jgi:hypothetical protein